MKKRAWNLKGSVVTYAVKSWRKTQAEHCDTSRSDIFSDSSPRMMEIKTKISKRELLKLKSFCTAKVKVKVKSLSLARFFTAPWTVACTKVLRPWDFPGKSTGVGCHFLLQGLFPTQGLNPHLLHCRQILYHLSHQGSPDFRISQ